MIQNYRYIYLIFFTFLSCNIDVGKGSAPEILHAEIIDNGSYTLENNTLFLGETGQFVIELSDKDINLSDIDIKYIHEGLTMYEQNETLSQYHETEDYSFSFNHSISVPLGEWSLEYTVNDKNGLSVSDSISYNVDSLINCLYISNYNFIPIAGSVNDKVSVSCEFDNTCSRNIDSIKFKILLYFTDGSTHESIHAIDKCFPGRTTSEGFTIFFDSLKTLQDVIIDTDSIELIIY